MMLPLITSPETIATMEWLRAEQQRYSYWREQAQQLVVQHGMEGAIRHLSALLLRAGGKRNWPPAWARPDSFGGYPETN
jgi:hypothetical protein